MFIVPDDNMLKKWFAYAVERWKGFKTQSINDYINHTKDNKVPRYVKYSYIDKKVWKHFVKSRTTPEFLAKSQKGKDNIVRNIYPRRLSCGGHDKLE